MLLISLILAATITTKADVPRVTAAELRALMDKGDAVALDVRGSVPYKYGHIANAVWMPLGLVDKRFGELPQDKLIVAYCTCKAEELSLEAAMALARKHGFERVAVLHGGYPAWKDAGYPTEGAPSEDEAPATPAPAASGRVAPPDAVKCDRNQLTMYSGRVKTFERKADTVTIAIDTTAGTTETVTASAFLMNGQPFTAEDWKQVGEGKDVVAWVCTGGPAVLDWRRAVSAAE